MYDGLPRPSSTTHKRVSRLAQTIARCVSEGMHVTTAQCFAGSWCKTTRHIVPNWVEGDWRAFPRSRSGLLFALPRDIIR